MQILKGISELVNALLKVRLGLVDLKILIDNNLIELVPSYIMMVWYHNVNTNGNDNDSDNDNKKPNEELSDVRGRNRGQQLAHL